MSVHLSSEDVRALVDGRTPERGAEAVEQHLASCEACRAALREARRADDTQTLDSVASGGVSPSGVVVQTPESRYEYARAATGAVEELGRGGFGKVVLARDTTLGRDVAMKRLTSERLARARDTSEARLLREARVMGQLEHPAIVPLHELGRGADGQLYYTMRRIRGRTLADALKEATTLDERLRLLPHVLTACHAVAYAHSRGVVHRDLKPQNVMLDRFGATYLIDWGLARARDVDESDAGSSVSESGALRLVTSDETLGEEGGRIGTVAYMSPEHLEGPRGLVDELSDVWGLGAMLYQVLTGRPPRDRAEADWRSTPRPVQQLVPEVPRDLAALCEKAMAPRREDRYPSAESLAADLDAWLHGRQVSAHVYRPTELLTRFVKANRVTVLVAAAAFVALLALGVASYLRVRTQRNQARAFAHLIIDQALERLSTTQDDEFVARFTTEVTDWLTHQGASDDAASVAWAWFLLARMSDHLGKPTGPLLDACLVAAQGVDDPVARAATVGCRALHETPKVDEVGPEQLAALEALWRDTPVTAETTSAPWLEARTALAFRLSLACNSRSEVAMELRYTDELVSLARQAFAHATDRAAALALVARALSRRSLVASSTGDGEGALRYGDESVAVARQAVAVRADSNTLEALASNLAQQVSVVRWHAAPGEADAQRAALGEEATQLFQALLVLTRQAPIIRQQFAWLLLELGDADRTWALLRDLDYDGASMLSRAPFGWAALATGHPEAVVAHRAVIEAGSDFDCQVGLALALGLTGQWADAAATLARARTLPMSSGWPAQSMNRFASAVEGPLGPGLQRFAARMDRALTDNDEAMYLLALDDLAAEWRARAAAPR
jgi:hypothetical protein